MSIAEIAVRILFFTLAWFPQNTRVAFEVASIRPSVNAPRQAVAAAGRTDDAQFRIAGLTIRDYEGQWRINRVFGELMTP
jgi:hypothetical protein